MSNQSISFRRIRLGSWVVLTGLLLIMIILHHYSIRQYIAERHYKDGVNFFAHNRLSYAVESYEKAIEAVPWDSHYYVYYSEVYDKVISTLPKQLDVALPKLNTLEQILYRLHKLDPINPWYSGRLAQFFLSKSEYYDPQSEDYLALINQSKYFFTLSQSQDLNNPLFSRSLAQFHQFYGDPSEALKYYEYTIKLDPRPGLFLTARYNLGHMYFQLNREADGLDQLLFIYESNPSFHDVSSFLGKYYLSKNNLTEAKRYFESDYNRNPRDIDAIQNLAEYYFYVSAYSDALVLFSKLHKRVPTNEFYKARYEFLLQHSSR